jgi:hypothetical protein
MRKLLKVFIAAIAAAAAGAAIAAQDPLLAVLEDSKASGRGVNIYVSGQSIPAVVVSVDDRFVTARSQAQGTIVIRLERIDAAAGFVGQPAAAPKKP